MFMFRVMNLADTSVMETGTLKTLDWKTSDRRSMESLT